MTVYLAGGDPEHLLLAYQLASERKGRLSFLDAEGKLRVPLHEGDKVCIVGDEAWKPLLTAAVAKAKAVLTGEVIVTANEWTVPPP